MCMPSVMGGKRVGGGGGVAPVIAGLNRMCANPCKLNKPLTEKMLYEF